MDDLDSRFGRMHFGFKHCCGLQGLDRNTVLYRVCRYDQDTDKAIKSKAKPGTEDAERSVEQHIASGSHNPSRFISTTTSSAVAMKWAGEHQPIIRIYLSRMTGIKALCEMINLTNEEVRENFIRGATHTNWAKSSQEVLFQWCIPKKNEKGENVFELWRKEMVSWEMMRKDWIDSGIDSAIDTEWYLNTFLQHNPGFSFTITQLYDELFHVCITTEQSLNIKRELEHTFNISTKSPRTQKLFPGGEREEKSFKNANVYKLQTFFQEKKVIQRNVQIIERKYNEASDQVTKLNEAFKTEKKGFQKDILAFDIEVYEHDHSKVLEIGYVTVRFLPRKDNLKVTYLEVTRLEHLIIEENLRYKNGETCPDNRDGFIFGESKTVSLADALERFCKDIRKCDYILGHTTKNDDAYLRKTWIDFSEFDKEMFDTQVLEIDKQRLRESENYLMRLRESENYLMLGLPYLLKEYNLNYKESHLHNAGCDAFYNMMVFLRQMNYSAKEVNDVIEYYSDN